MFHYAKPKQITFIDRLAVERDWESGVVLGNHCARVREVIARQAPNFSIHEASNLIDMLLACPMKESKFADPGYYVRNGDVYVVVMNRAGTATYAKAMVVSNGRGKWEYAPGVGRDIVAEGLVPLTVTEAAWLGRMHGACMVCGRTLTDPESVQRGIGPVCAMKL